MKFLPLIAYLTALGLIIFYVIRMANKGKSNLEKSRVLLKNFALTHNLNHEQNYNDEESLVGTYNNVQVSLYEETSDNGRYVFFYTIMAAYLPRTTTLQNLEILPRTLRSRLSFRSTPPNLKTGIAALDKHFIIQGIPGHLIQEIFTHPDIKDALLHLRHSGKNVHLKNGILSVQYNNHLALNLRHIPDTLNALTRCIQALEPTTRHGLPSTSSTPDLLHNPAQPAYTENINNSW